MPGKTLLDIGIVLLLILVEALFAAAEMALVSLRDGQVRTLADTGRRGAAVARLTADPNRFLAAVQLAITFVSLLAGAFGAVTLAGSLHDVLVDAGLGSGAAEVVAVVAVTLVISFVTIVIGELVPKRLALQRAEGSALLLGPPLGVVATLFRPAIWLLSRTTDGIVRMLGGDPGAAREPISEDELRGLVAAHESLTTDERRLIDDVFAAGERSVGEVMVPRTEVTFLEASMTISRAAKVAADSPHSRYPVVGRSQDDVLGFVHIRDLLLDTRAAGRDRTVGDLVREVKALPGSKHVLAALSEMRREGHHLAIVVDEYGGTDGIVSLEDLIEEVIGDIRDEYDATGDESRRLLGGAVEVDGKANLDEIAELAGVELPEGPYATVAGYVVARVGRLPEVGDEVEYEGHRLQVTQVEGRRAARIRVTPPPGPQPTASPTSPAAQPARQTGSGEVPESAHHG